MEHSQNLGGTLLCYSYCFFIQHEELSSCLKSVCIRNDTNNKPEVWLYLENFFRKGLITKLLHRGIKRNRQAHEVEMALPLAGGEVKWSSFWGTRGALMRSHKEEQQGLADGSNRLKVTAQKQTRECIPHPQFPPCSSFTCSLVSFQGFPFSKNYWLPDHTGA